jgi:hypothetical protein
MAAPREACQGMRGLALDSSTVAIDKRQMHKSNSRSIEYGVYSPTVG